MNSVFFASVLACLLGVVSAKALKIDAMEHDITQITASNFDGVIAKFRDSQVSSLWFFKPDNKADQAFLDEYNKLGKDLKHMVKVAAINCDDWSVFCKKNDVKETPSLMMYPTNPIPAFKYEGKLEAKALAAKLTKFIPDYSSRVQKDNVDSFITSDPDKPKVLLFSNKPKPPTILKALSSETVFKRTVKFGFVTEQDKEVCQKLKITKFPTLLLVRGAKSEIKEKFTGDLTFTSIKDWVNLYSESGSGTTVHSAHGKETEESIEESKPWLVQEIPEVTQKSQQDICFKNEGLCVIYLTEGTVSQSETDMLSALSKKFTSQLSDRGTKMKWMWMDMKAEAGFKNLFNPPVLPSAVVFNPHKRLRFTLMDHGEDNDVKGNDASISHLLDKVLGGDARFKMVPGQKLPAFAARGEAPKKKSEL